MKPRVVLDSSTVVSAIGWHGDARLVIRLLAKRRFLSFRNAFLTREWLEATQHVAENYPRWETPNWVNWLEWLKHASKLVENAPSAKISRDAKDDFILAAALSARAQWLVTKDNDLLVLDKPFGIACVTPRAFLSAMLKAG